MKMQARVIVFNFLSSNKTFYIPTSFAKQHLCLLLVMHVELFWSVLFYSTLLKLMLVLQIFPNLRTSNSIDVYKSIKLNVASTFIEYKLYKCCSSFGLDHHWTVLRKRVDYKLLTCSCEKNWGHFYIIIL